MLSPWTLSDAVDMVRELRPLVKDLGYFVTIGGGVLERGSSQNDLDLFLIPLRSDRIKKDPQGVVQLLTKLWGYGRSILDKDGDYYQPPPAPAPPQAQQVAVAVNPWRGDEDPVDNDDDRDDDDERERPEFKASDIYSHALSFNRNGDDKIEVFIIGGK